LNYISGHDKSYRATIRLGIGTTTDDAEGEYREYDGARTYGRLLGNILALAVSDLTLTRLNDLVQRHFTGEIEQVPSSYSAVKGAWGEGL
jgi:tRNA pseudouridine55 synthase